MKRLISFAFCLSLAVAMTSGCGEKATTTKTETVRSPQGTTTVEEKDTVKTKGENPPNP
ncbi:MAG TPA: hypothetical protein VHC22_05875 [Pirellulales bacterium]|nr:hypothetical protein [Pirellulales bacterium]